MTNRNIAGLLFASLFFGCIHITRSSSNNRADCYGLLKDILAIQDYRNNLSTKMHETTVAYKDNKISLEEFRGHREEWLMKENNLYHQVSTMYDTAYETRCLE